MDGSEAERKEAADAILTGFKTAGFVYLKNHMVSPDTLKHIFSMSANFFAQPIEAKKAVSWTTPQANRGYSAQGREKVTMVGATDVGEMRTAAPDLKESLEIGRDDEPGFPNQWPQENGNISGFKTDMLGFFDQCKKMHIQVMRAIAVGMGLAEDFFDQYVDVGDNTLRLLHYPSVKADVFKINPGQVRAGEHTVGFSSALRVSPRLLTFKDYGSVTLLFQDNRGGLQVRSPSGKFVNATPIENTVVINAGDLLARWSNDSLKSTIHRVVEPPSKATDSYPSRYSIA